MSDRTAACGTEAGYRSHRYLKEVPCQPCRDAHAAHARSKRVPRPPRPVPACGTMGGIHRHYRLGETPCRPCLDAAAEYQRERREPVAYPQMECLSCGKVFTPQRKDNRGVCSPNCSVKLTAKRIRQANGTDSERPCVYCEAVFVAKHRDTEVCSKECQHALRPFRARGLHPADYRTMLDAQGHACAICRAPLGRTRRERHIDHCHSTGAVRGVLCPGCNLMLGHSKDAPSVLRAAAEYLEQHPS